MDSSSSFPFMNLPLEVRLMIYERLPIEIKQYQFTKSNPNGSNPYSFTIVSKSLDSAILTTNRQINSEAWPIIDRKLQDILQTPPRLIVDTLSSIKLHKCGGPLWHISRIFAERARKANKNLRTVPYLGTGMGAGAKRYDPQADPDHARLAHLISRWIRGLEYQQMQSSQIHREGELVIEFALTNSDELALELVSYSLRQLAYILFAEHGGLRFSLRSVRETAGALTEEMRIYEKGIIDKVLIGRSGNVSRAVQGACISIVEFNNDWSDRSYHRGSIF